MHSRFAKLWLRAYATTVEWRICHLSVKGGSHFCSTYVAPTVVRLSIKEIWHHQYLSDEFRRKYGILQVRVCRGNWWKISFIGKEKGKKELNRKRKGICEEWFLCMRRSKKLPTIWAGKYQKYHRSNIIFDKILTKEIIYLRNFVLHFRSPKKANNTICGH